MMEAKKEVRKLKAKKKMKRCEVAKNEAPAGEAGACQGGRRESVFGPIWRGARLTGSLVTAGARGEAWLPSSMR